MKKLYRKVNNSYIAPVDTLRLTVSRVILGLNESGMNFNIIIYFYVISNRYNWNDYIEEWIFPFRPITGIIGSTGDDVVDIWCIRKIMVKLII